MFHNLKSYDGHLQIREAFKINQRKENNSLCAIPNPNKKLMSRTIGDNIFSGAFVLLNKTWDKLVQTLWDNENDDKYLHFNYMPII